MGQILHVMPGESLSGALDKAPPGSVIQLAPGTYREKLCLRTPGLTIRGAGAEESVITWDDYAEKALENLNNTGARENLNLNLEPSTHRRIYGTFYSYTLAVCADDVTLRELGVVNGAGQPVQRGQEVALSVYGDRFLMEGARLASTQDTLFLGPLPEDLVARYSGFLPRALCHSRVLSQRLEDCLIEGTVDFVFGCGDAVFTRCELRSCNAAQGTGYVAAPAHAEADTHGFWFTNCRFTRTSDVPDGSVYLARPWRDYGLACFEHCSYDAHIHPAGFDPWLDSGREATARFYETPARRERVPWAHEL